MKKRWTILILLLLSCGKTITKEKVDLKTDDVISNPDDTINTSENSSTQSGFTGTDMNGNSKTCKDVSATTICSSMFTPSDQYALTCKNNGNTAVMCGCHDWICVEN